MTDETNSVIIYTNALEYLCSVLQSGLFFRMRRSYCGI